MDDMNDSFDEDLNNDKNSRMFEDASSFISSNYPKALREFYNKCNLEGFNPEQSMSLVGRYFEMLLNNAANQMEDSDSGEFDMGGHDED